MVGCDYLEKEEIQRVVEGWRCNRNLLHKSDIIDNRFIELDGKKLVAIDYIYTLEIAD